MSAIDRCRASRHRASRTVARARFTDDLRVAHQAGAHTDPDQGTDPSGYWAEAGCPGCCLEVASA